MDSPAQKSIHARTQGYNHTFVLLFCFFWGGYLFIFLFFLWCVCCFAPTLCSFLSVNNICFGNEDSNVRNLLSQMICGIFKEMGGQHPGGLPPSDEQSFDWCRCSSLLCNNKLNNVPYSTYMYLKVIDTTVCSPICLFVIVIESQQQHIHNKHKRIFFG